MRPANIITSVADVLAGIAIAGYLLRPVSVHTGMYLSSRPPLLPVFLLCLSTACLYAGGIVFNDVFDLELDRIERPERALPSGIISVRNAGITGLLLLCAGILFALGAGPVSGGLAAGIAFTALVYDRFGKHLRLLGPLNMGLCRGLNLLLGISILPGMLAGAVLIALVPVAYIYAITMISRGEVSGGSKRTLYLATGIYTAVVSIILSFAFSRSQLLLPLIFILPFAFMIFRPLLTAISTPIGKNIGLAVRAGVLALVLMDAAWAAAFGSFYLALVIALLLPVSIWLSSRFAVT